MALVEALKRRIEGTKVKVNFVAKKKRFNVRDRKTIIP